MSAWSRRTRAQFVAAGAIGTVPGHGDRPRTTRGHRSVAGVVLGLLLASAAGAQPAPAASPAPPGASLAERIDAHVNAARFAGASWGIQVASIDSGRILYEHDAQRLLVPASAAKLYTAALALDTLGANHRIATSLFASARPLRDGTLRGDLILYGYGDPTLGSELHARWADELAEAVRKAGIRKVDGDLIADATHFASASYGGGWEAEDLQSWFAVPASALSIGENVVGLWIAPGARPGEPARLRFEPPVLGQAYDVVNELRTVAPPGRSDINLVRRPGERRLGAFGQVAQHARESEYRLSLPDPPLLAGHLLRRALGERGIEVTGKLRSISWPRTNPARADAALWHLADTWSPPLSVLLERGLKRSHNLYLQNLLLIVGAHEQQRAAAAATAAGQAEAGFLSTEQYGLRAMRRYLARLGIAPGAAVLDDGAGLSRRSLTSAAAFVKLLLACADAPAMRAFRSALPEAGVDGTLARRLNGDATRGRVFAKTGAMRNVAALAGYATTLAGERIAFAIILDNYVRSAEAARASAEVDAIVAMLIDAPPSTAAAAAPAAPL